MKILKVRKRYQSDKYTREVEKQLKRSADKAKKDMDSTTKKFNRVSPNFIIEEGEKSGGLYAVIGPENNKDGLIWFFLDRGTDVRYAVMTPDFVAKTKPNTLLTVKGRGGLSHFDFNNPRPGIAARLWTKIIKDKELPKFQNNVIKAVSRVTKRQL